MQSFNLAGIHYHLERVKCGKRGCTRCPHGPYWFAYDYRRVYTKKTYVGKTLPVDVQACVDRGEVTLQRHKGR